MSWYISGINVVYPGHIIPCQNTVYHMCDKIYISFFAIQDYDDINVIYPVINVEIYKQVYIYS